MSEAPASYERLKRELTEANRVTTEEWRRLNRQYWHVVALEKNARAERKRVAALLADLDTLVRRCQYETGALFPSVRHYGHASRATGQLLKAVEAARHDPRALVKIHQRKEALKRRVLAAKVHEVATRAFDGILSRIGSAISQAKRRHARLVRRAREI